MCLKDYLVPPESVDLGKVLGRGTYGVVHQAFKWIGTWPSDGGTVAVKCISRVIDDDICTPTWRELSILRSIRHPHLLHLRGIVAKNQEMWIILDHMDQNLDQLMRNDFYSHYSAGHVLSFTQQLLLAVHHLHKCGIMHRDVKPANILVSSSNHLKVCDYGLSCGTAPPQDPSPPDHTTMTQHVATRYYRSPEVILLEPYGHPLDNWSVGCVIAEMYLSHANHQCTYLFNGVCSGLTHHVEGTREWTKDSIQRYEMDTPYSQLRMILSKLGPFRREDLTPFYDLALVTQMLSLSIQYRSIWTETRLHHLPPPMIAMLQHLLQLNPLKRATMEDALTYLQDLLPDQKHTFIPAQKVEHLHYDKKKIQEEFTRLLAPAT